MPEDLATSLGSALSSRSDERHSRAARNQPGDLRKSSEAASRSKTGSALGRRLSELTVSTKRRSASASALESWYPYYAGFPASFVEAVLDIIDLPRGSVVLDQWNGSGTTTEAASRRGYASIGLDINPVAAVIAGAKHAHVDEAQRVVSMARELLAKAQSSDLQMSSPGDPMLRWLTPSLVGGYRSLERSAEDRLWGGAGETTPKRQVSTSSFLRLSLIRAAQTFCSRRPASNPAWNRPADLQGEGSATLLERRWSNMVRRMGAELSDRVSTTRRAPAKIDTADSRNLPLLADSVDLIVTSPPYCTRLDYAINTSFALAVLGISDKSPEFAELRRSLMGTTLSRRQHEFEVERFPHSVQKLLAAIRQHPSKASSGYYFRTYYQYFSDALDSLAEMARVLRPRGCGVLVVQSSFYKEIRVDLPELYSDLARATGLRASVVRRDRVRRVLSTINSRSRAHRRDAIPDEAIVFLEKP